MKRGRPKKQDPFSIVLKIGEKKYEESGKNLVEAIEKLKPEKITGKTIISIKHGNKSHEFPFHRVFFLKKLIMNKTARELFAKRALMFLQ
mgnify:CR=1 FL=1